MDKRTFTRLLTGTAAAGALPRLSFAQGKTSVADLAGYAGADREQRLVDGAKKDAAFDAWCGEPEVRELLGLPAVSSMDVPARLTERTATWTLQGSSCRNPWATLVFAPGRPGKDGKIAGQGSLEIAESCKGQKTKQKQALSWTQTPAGPFVVTTKPLEQGSLKVPARATIVLDDTHQQLKLAPDDGGDAIGTFEPGRALIDDSVL